MPKQNSEIDGMYVVLYIKFDLQHKSQTRILWAPNTPMKLVLDLELNLLLNAVLGVPCLNKIQESAPFMVHYI